MFEKKSQSEVNSLCFTDGLKNLFSLSTLLQFLLGLAHDNEAYEEKQGDLSEWRWCGATGIKCCFVGNQPPLRNETRKSPGGGRENTTVEAFHLLRRIWGI